MRLPLFQTLVADPPWKHDDSLGKRGAAAQYKQVLTLEDIKAFPLPPMAANSYLVMWRVASMVEEAYEVVRAWGFIPKTEIVWVKKTVHGKIAFGQGRTVRGAHETAIIARRGKAKPLVRNIRSVFAAPLGEHSEKPVEFYRLIEQLLPGPRAELFARKLRPGWTQWGDELPGRPAAPPAHRAA